MNPPQTTPNPRGLTSGQHQYSVLTTPLTRCFVNFAINRDATVHLTKDVPGKELRKRHLCEVCFPSDSMSVTEQAEALLHFFPDEPPEQPEKPK